MAAAGDVRVHGFGQLAAGTAALAGRIEDDATHAFSGVAGTVAAQVAGRLPRRTGATAASATVYHSGDAVGPAYGAGVRAARFVEYGGRGHPHSGTGNYLYPAAQEAEPQLELAAQTAARKAIGGMSWPRPM